MIKMVHKRKNFLKFLFDFLKNAQYNKLLNE